MAPSTLGLAKRHNASVAKNGAGFGTRIGAPIDYYSLVGFDSLPPRVEGSTKKDMPF
jgi:hypothetical protein